MFNQAAIIPPEVSVAASTHQEYPILNFSPVSEPGGAKLPDEGGFQPAHSHPLPAILIGAVHRALAIQPGLEEGEHGAAST